MEKMTFTTAMNKFFGKKDGQTMSEFSQELKALTMDDRRWFVAEFAKTCEWEVSLTPSAS